MRIHMEMHDVKDGGRMTVLTSRTKGRLTLWWGKGILQSKSCTPTLHQEGCNDAEVALSLTSDAMPHDSLSLS